MRARRAGTAIIALVLSLAVVSGDIGAATATDGARPGAPPVTVAPPPIPLRGGRPLMTAVQAPTDSCHPNTDTMSAGEAARNLMAGRYKLGHHPLVSLGQRPSWAEDPLHDRNWRERFQMLRFLMALMIEWQDSGDPRYRDRALELLRSWIAR